MNHQEAVEKQAAERYLLGEFSSPERNEFEEHFFGCRECAEEVRAGAAFTANLRAIFEQEATSRVPDAAGSGWQRWLRPAFLIPAAVAGLFFSIVLYQSLFVIPGLRRTLARVNAPQAYPAFFLHSVARGDEQTIAVAAADSFVGLSFDVPPERKYSRYECELAGPSGSEVVSAAAPESPGAPINVLVARSSLRAGRHTLVLRGRDPGSPAVELGRYGFTVVLK